MDISNLPALTRRSDMLARATALCEMASARAAELDRGARFPIDDLRDMARDGLLAAPLGSGPWDEREDALWMLELLYRLGAANLALGRIFEAHVNALRLITLYGSPAQQASAAHDVSVGKLFALWVTDTQASPLRTELREKAVLLTGGKSFCSAAGFADRAVVTAATGSGQPRMLVLPLHESEQVRPSSIALLGMRAATTGEVDFTGCRFAPDVLLGEPDDYMREPEFSNGAWRSSAVALGGLSSLLKLTRAQLVARGRDANQHQRARMGKAMIAQHTAWLWLLRAAPLAHSATTDPREAVSYIGLTRIAVEAACLEGIELAQRSLGLSAFMQTNPVERVCRDLATYLRQPAPDEALDEAAAYFMTRDLPGEPQ
jgi:alkylation response protein AidB-like acyl-CoA dehydrogenase